MKPSRWLLCVIMVMTFPIVTGCWDRLEIEDRGAVLGLAIDPLPDGSENITGPYAKSDSPGYKLTAQLAIPGRIPLGPGEGTTGGGAEKPVWVVRTSGKTIDDAMNNLQQELADKLFLGHLRVIIVNQKLAKTAGVQDIQDFFRRNAEIRRLAWLIISKGDASKAMEASPKLERVPTLYLVGTMDHAVQVGKLPNIFLGNYWSVLSSKGQDPLLPFISVKGKDRIRTEGLAVFKGTKMVGSLDALATANYMELMNQKLAGYGVAFPVPGDPDHSVIVKGTNRRTKVKVRQVNGTFRCDFYSRIEANIEERTGRRRIDEVVPQVADEATKFVVNGQNKLIRETQAMGTDIFGIGEHVRGQFPEYWTNHIKTRDDWDQVFRRLPIHVYAKVYIRRSGMSAR